LTFHAIEDAASVIAFPPALFRDLMGKLSAAGYRSLELLELARLIAERRPFPERSFALTFDDGYQTVYEHAFPVLQQFSFSATIFLTVDEKGHRTDSHRLASLEQRPMLSWGEIREMDRAGLSFGAHTLTHPDLRRLTLSQAQNEISASKQIIESALGKAVHCFAYPYGRYDDRSRRIARQQFACACGDELALASAVSDLFALERVDAYYLRSKACFNLMLTPFFPGYVHMRNIPRRIRRAAKGI
jgi:peptidoglycan/xylan/chitin deacetylase (PgdA/CDA1 family)